MNKACITSSKIYRTMITIGVSWKKRSIPANEATNVKILEDQQLSYVHQFSNSHLRLFLAIHLRFYKMHA
jgi:hypothetical protein